MVEKGKTQKEGSKPLPVCTNIRDVQLIVGSSSTVAGSTKIWAVVEPSKGTVRALEDEVVLETHCPELLWTRLLEGL